MYYVIDIRDYQLVTSCVKSAALLSCVLSGILGDILVVEFDTSLMVLMWISAAFVWTGFFIGLFIIRKPNKTISISYEKKIFQFRTQIRYLLAAVRLPHVSCMLLLWIIGNAVFSVR